MRRTQAAAASAAGAGAAALACCLAAAACDKEIRGVRVVSYFHHSPLTRSAGASSHVFGQWWADFSAFVRLNGSQVWLWSHLPEQCPIQSGHYSCVRILPHAPALSAWPRLSGGIALPTATTRTGRRTETGRARAPIIQRLAWPAAAAPQSDPPGLQARRRWQRSRRPNPSDSMASPSPGTAPRRRPPAPGRAEGLDGDGQIPTFSAPPLRSAAGQVRAPTGDAPAGRMRLDTARRAPGAGADRAAYADLHAQQQYA